MPKQKIDVHPDVYSELGDSRAWYDERAENLGIDFLNEIYRAVNAIQEAPMMWPYSSAPKFADIQIKDMVAILMYGYTQKILIPTIAGAMVQQ